MSAYLQALFLISESRVPMDDRKRDLLQHNPGALVDELMADPPQYDFQVERRRRGIEAIPALSRDNSNLSPAELHALAASLSPGGVHDGGVFASAIFLDGGRWRYCNRLMVAMLYFNWTGGKAGFQFMPNPEEIDLEEYSAHAEELQSLLIDGGPPEAILVDDDLKFYESLPNVLTVYRGVSGIPFEIAEFGFCWTTNKQAAEWFAHRHATDDRPPMLLMARVGKRRVMLAHAMESEVVVLAPKVRQIKCGPKRAAPWQKATVAIEKLDAELPQDIYPTDKTEITDKTS